MSDERDRCDECRHYLCSCPPLGMNPRLGVPLQNVKETESPPFTAMDPVVTLARKAGRVISCFRQPLGAKRWVCWVGFPDGSHVAHYAGDLLRVQPQPDDWCSTRAEGK